MRRASKNQIKMIHYLAIKLSLKDYEYRAMLKEYGVETSKELEYENAKRLIRKMLELLPDKEKIYGGNNYKKYEDLGMRYNEKLKEHYATPKQLRMIEAMWMTSPHVKKKDEEALRKFVKRILGKDHITWILKSEVEKVVKAIESLKTNEIISSNA